MIAEKIFVIEHSAWPKMKKNDQIYVPQIYIRTINFTYQRPQCNQLIKMLNFHIRKWKPCFSGICQKVNDRLWLFSRLPLICATVAYKITSWHCYFSPLISASSNTISLTVWKKMKKWKRKWMRKMKMLRKKIKKIIVMIMMKKSVFTLTFSIFDLSFSWCTMLDYFYI